MNEYTGEESSYKFGLPPRNPHLEMPLSKVRSSRVLGISSGSDVGDGDSLSSGGGNPDLSRVDEEAAGVLEEVVVLAGGSRPRLTAVGADLEALDGLVVVYDLHREPPLGGALLVADVDGGADATGNELVRGANSAICASDGLEGIGEEIEVPLSALGALINNLNG